MSTPEPGMKRVSEMSIVERLRNNLQPQGTAPLVQLHFNGVTMYHADFVSKCIDEIERMEIRVALGDKISDLEKLAFQLLLDSAYIDLKGEAEREAKLAEYAKEL